MKTNDSFLSLHAQALNISDTIAKDDEKDNYITVCVLSELAELYLQLGQVISNTNRELMFRGVQYE